jgi:hypothetical protein
VRATQQIMHFAMAMDDPFMLYEADFKAQCAPLKNNYRPNFTNSPPTG